MKAVETKRAIVEKARHESKGPLRAAFILVDADRARGGSLLAGGLAYRLFLWLLPAALAATSLVSLFSQSRNAPPAELARAFGMGRAFASSIARAATETGRGAALLFVMGVSLMVLAAMGCLKAFRLIAFIAWDLPTPAAQVRFHQPIALSMLLILFSIYPTLLRPLYAGDLLGDVAASLIAVAGLTALAAWALARARHPPSLRWFHFLPGAILVAVGIETLRLATALYFARKLERIDDLYGGIGLAAVFMTYIYLVARLCVLAFMTNAAIWRLRSFQSRSQQ